MARMHRSKARGVCEYTPHLNDPRAADALIKLTECHPPSRLLDLSTPVGSRWCSHNATCSSDCTRSCWCVSPSTCVGQKGALPSTLSRSRGFGGTAVARAGRGSSCCCSSPPTPSSQLVTTGSVMRPLHGAAILHTKYTTAAACTTAPTAHLDLISSHVGIISCAE
jgi:hypothetical protein